MLCLPMYAPLPEGHQVQVLLSEDQDHFLRIQNLYHLGIIQKDRNNQKQENPVTGLTYKTLCKRQDGLHEMMSYTYLSPTDTRD